MSGKNEKNNNKIKSKIGTENYEKEEIRKLYSSPLPQWLERAISEDENEWHLCTENVPELIVRELDFKVVDTEERIMRILLYNLGVFLIKKSLERLDKDEAFVIKNRLGINNKKMHSRSLREIATRSRYSEENILHIYNKALVKVDNEVKSLVRVIGKRERI